MHNALEKLRSPTHVGVMTQEEREMTVRHADLKIVDQRLLVQQMDFEKWTKQSEEKERLRPLNALMMNLARQDNGAGIHLRYEQNRLQFDYQYLYIVAEKSL